MKRELTIGLLAFAYAGIAAATSHSNSNSHTSHHAASVATASSADEMAQGEVRRINKDTKKITLRHGPIRSIDMPPMSMVFSVRDAAVLDTVKVGDVVEFTVVKDPDGSLIVTSMQPKR